MYAICIMVEIHRLYNVYVMWIFAKKFCNCTVAQQDMVSSLCWKTVQTTKFHCDKKINIYDTTQ